MNTCCTPANQTQTNPATQASGLKPRYNVNGNKDAYAIQVELPGVKKENVSINLDGELLTLHAVRSVAAPAGWKPLHQELAQDDFLLRLKLNAPVDENKLAARLEDGVLTLSLPLKEAARPRAIPVN